MTSAKKIMATVKEYSAMTGIGQNTVRKMCYMADFPATKVGNKFLIHIEAANEWLRRRAEAKDGIDANLLRRCL